MFPTYNSLAEVPEAFREHYKMSGGRAVAEVSTDHPLVTNSATLLNQKNTAEQERDTARSEAQTAKDALASANVLPRGHKAVPNAEYELLEAVKSEGFTKPEEVKQAKAAVGELAARKSADHLRAVAKELGYEPEAFVRLQGLPEFEIRDGADGKKTIVAKVKDAAGTVTEKPAAEFVESSPDIAPFLPALKSESGGTRVHGTSSTTTSRAANTVYEQHVKDVEQKYGKGDAPRKSWKEEIGLAAR